MRVRLSSLHALVAASAALIVAASVHAAPVSAFGGFDHSSGAFGQRTDGWIAGASLSAAAADVAVAGVRYDDTLIGRGTSLTGVAGVAVAPTAQLRVAATRFIGDDAFRGWRTRVGPRFSLPTGQSLWLTWVHYQDNTSVHSNGAGAEATTPLVAGLTGRANASYATAPQGPAAIQGAVGLGWRVIPHAELSGEVGLSRNGASVTQPFPGGGILGPLIGGGGGSSTTTENKVATTVLLGVRVFVP
ncbi:MAG: hypothetical protein HYR74_12520 [Candidatus Eisenbacteria bacterium]|nr:hypothetical protein [Candidatus Eisenbacteria bacterium]